MDILKEAIEVGLGSLALTREKAQKLAKDLVKKNKLEKNEGERLINELRQKGRKQEKQIAAALSKIMKQAFSQLNIASKADISRMEKEIKRLKARKK
jgi:polyhydroxyalkanoate synthesis regulator phasin